MQPSKNATKLPKRAIKVWRLNYIGWNLLLWCIPLFLWVFHFAGSGQYGWLVWGATIVIFAFSIWSVVFYPKVRWREWYYGVDEDNVELQNGVIILQQTLVPLNRVQHVDTRQGPILDNYGLADVIISTAATKHRIPALDTDTAEMVRKQITEFAKQARRDV